MAKSFRENVFDLNVDLFIQGFKDTLEKKDPKYTEKELEEAVTHLPPYRLCDEGPRRR